MKIKIEMDLSFFRFGKKKERKEMSLINDDFIQKAMDIADSSERSHATVRNYITAINSYRNYCRETNVNREMLTGEIVAAYRSWLQDNDICRNTASCYIRSLRALYNLIGETETAPFSAVPSSNDCTIKRALTAEEVRRIKNLPLDGRADLSMYRDIFLFCVYTLGMPFVDVVKLKKDTASNDLFFYHRSKTDTPITVCLLPQAVDIIQRYEHMSGDYLFPFAGQFKSYSHYQYELTKYNKALREIGLMAMVRPKLTSYVARHTWASLALLSGVNLAVISQALGHSNIKTTQIYLKSLGACEMRDVSMKVASMFE